MGPGDEPYPGAEADHGGGAGEVQAGDRRFPGPVHQGEAGPRREACPDALRQERQPRQVDAETGSVIANLPIGEGTDFAEFDPNRGLAFSSNRDGTLSIIAEKSPTSFAALPAVTTEIGARTMAVDPKTGRIYLATAEMTVNGSAAANDSRRRYSVKPGSVKLLFFDPMPK